MTQETLVLGGGPLGLEIATELAVRDRSVAFVGTEPATKRARDTDLPVYESALESASPSVDCAASIVVVATPSDARNLLLAAAAPRTFDAERVVVLVNDPDRETAFDAAGVETVCVSRAIARVTTDSMTVVDEDPRPPDDEDPTVDRKGTDRGAGAGNRFRSES